MIQYRKILELYHKAVSQRSISASTGASRQTVSKVIHRAKEKEIDQLTEEMTNHWLKSYLFPLRHRQVVGLLKKIGVMSMNNLKRNI